MRIAILTGGESGEREVSIWSADNVRNLIDFAETKTFILPEALDSFQKESGGFDLAIPMIHGVGGEDGTLQLFLAKAGIPFVFSDAHAHKIGIDKQETKRVASTCGINTPAEKSAPPFFAKPRFGGSSVATKVCESTDEFRELAEKNPGMEFVTEELIRGREFTVGVVESNKKTLALPVIEIVPKGSFFDFENKYNPEKLAEEICPAQISETFAKELQRQALVIHNKIGARHLSRSDFMVTSDGKIYFLEINTIPGMTKTSLVPKMVHAAGLSLPTLLKEWCSNPK